MSAALPLRIKHPRESGILVGFGYGRRECLSFVANLRRDRCHRRFTGFQLRALLADDRVTDALGVKLGARCLIPPDEPAFAVNHCLTVGLTARMRHPEGMANRAGLIGDQIIG